MSISIDKIDVNTKRKYNRAKTQLLYRAPFFGALMLQCQHIWTNEVPTMATDGVNLYFNPNYVSNLSDEELMGVLVHEICHKMYLHRLRAEKYAEFKNGRLVDVQDGPKMKKWNIACDYAINPIVLEAGFKLPENALLDDKYKGMLAEKIYDLLPDDTGNPENHFIFTSGNQATSNEASDELKRQIKLDTAAAAAMSKDHGNLPSDVKKLLNENAKSTVDWRAVLSAFIEESIFGDDDITFKRPNRRMLVHDMYLPSTEGIQTPAISIMYDTSGSIYSYPEVTEQFTAEIQSISEHLLPEAIHIICNDTRVQSHDIFERGEDVHFNLKGGGGTCFIQAFKHIQELDEYAPKVNIVFTDLYFDYSNLEPSIPTLWVVYGDYSSDEPPFGTVVRIE